MTDTSLAAAEEARRLDEADPLARFRQAFHVPVGRDGRERVYLAGNSLGLMPKRTRTLVDEELEAWARLGVDGHFEGPRPWFSYHELFIESGAALVGAVPGEVVAMNGLTTNLHLLMVSFYRPTQQRFKIVIEAGCFPSDRYAVDSQARFHGYDPKDAIVELAPRAGEDLLRTEDVEKYFAAHGGEVALVLMGGVNYYTGQAFDLQRIARAAKGKGAVVGFDLAHAAGNLQLALHDWDVDFAAWCSYKYLNSGPGSVAMAFVHQRHAKGFDLPRFCGWWGNDPKTRFVMGRDFTPQEGAGGWQLSNAPVLSMAALKASLDLFVEAGGMSALRAKSEQLTAFMLRLLDARAPKGAVVITPRDPAARGCQVSIRTGDNAEAVCERLGELGVVVDFRRPDVVRVAPVPLYNSFADVAAFTDALASSLK